ncbi:uncharacterized protein LOC142233257 [Haematobia irritans]|uniref:uncharacterized protein LOC142233257 n=1 Tax=Haematobia irritans TaxID=7368 RepID=UPI003F50849E
MDKTPTLHIKGVGKILDLVKQTTSSTAQKASSATSSISSSPKLSTKIFLGKPLSTSLSSSTSCLPSSSSKHHSNIAKSSKRYRLQRSTDNFDDADVENFLNSPKTALTPSPSVLSVMGGGFVTPPTAAYTKNYIESAATTVALLTNFNNEAKSGKASTTPPPPSPPPPHEEPDTLLPMHEKLLENDGCDKNPPTKTETKVKHKPHKESKFAEKLRRSFRRAEHKSLEIKRQDKIDTNVIQERSGSLRPLHQQLHNSASIFSLTNLPGLGGHINPALLLDSPDESTPPEFAYRHLSSVATTNSSTSLESNFCESPTTSISYWAWHMNNNNMGSEVSTNSNVNSNQTTQNPNNRTLNTKPDAGAAVGQASSGSQRSKRLEQQSSSKSDHGDHPAVTADSRSCSTASESSTAAKLTRLQNFLFKSSNESSRSIQGHSNEGFTVSSFNSSSGEWENLCNFPSTSQNVTISDDLTQFPLAVEEERHQVKKESLSDSNGSLRNYYQYTLASPSNPFLPEITARTYHSTYEEAEEDQEIEDELDSNVTSVKYSIGSHSAQMPTPNYSRTGSQESTHSEYGACGGKGATSSLGTSTPGKHKRKLFSLSTPTKLDFPTTQTQTAQIVNTTSSSQHHHNHHHQNQRQPPPPVPAASAAAHSHQSNVGKASTCNLVRSLNPFLPSTTVTSSSPPQRTSSSSSLNKQQRSGPYKQQAVTSPIAIPMTAASSTMSSSASPALKDLNARREEFLKATMQICLVVSPPSTRLQVIY